MSYLRHYLTGLWVPEKHIQRTNYSTDPAPLTPGPAPCSPPFHPSTVLNRRETSPHGPLLLSRTMSYLRHYLTGLWVPKKHTQRTNYSTHPAPLTPGPAPCSPPLHPPIVLNRRETSPHGPLLLSRTMSYLRHYLTGLWIPEKHIQRANACTHPAPLTPGPASCSPPFHPPTVLNRRETSPYGPPSPQPHVLTAFHSPSARAPCFW